MLDACRFSRLMAPCVLALLLGACSSDIANFSVADLNPLNKTDALRSADYNYFYSRDQRAGATGFVSAADLVGPNGRCAFEAAPAPALGPAAPAPAAAEPVAPAPSSDPINPRSNQALYFTAQGGSAPPPTTALPPVVSGGPRGVALQMTECEVVRVAGYTDRVEIGSDARGQRTVTLTYMSGARPGIYRFVGGRLNAMERVAEPPQPTKPQRATKTAKKSAPR